MCYHSLYLFLTCGHSVPASYPLRNAPPCRARAHRNSGNKNHVVRRPSQASPIEPCSHWRALPDPADGFCKEKLSHPLHTYRINSLCMMCLREREERLARFEIGAIAGEVERGLARKGTIVRAEVKVVNVLRSGYEEGKSVTSSPSNSP